MRRFLWAVAFASLLPSCLLVTCADGARRDESSDDEEDEPRTRKKKKARADRDTTARSSDVVLVPSLKQSTTASPVKPPPRPVIGPDSPVAPPVAPTPVPLPPTPPTPTPTPAPSEDRATARSWAHQVALGSEFAATGKSRDGVVARWNKPIRLSVMRGDATVRADLLSLVPTLNEALTPAGATLRVVEDGDVAAEMKVYFAPSTEFEGIAKANGFTYITGNDGYFFIYWNAAFELTRAYVLIATDKLSGKRLRHITFEEVTQALGLSNDSALLADSIFYEDAAVPDTDDNVQTELTARDRRLLSFFYTRVRPGDRRAAFDRAFDAHW